MPMRKKTLKELKEGKVDILIGTHRLLSKDVTFSNLGLMVIDEEQKFGVIHKERIKKIACGCRYADDVGDSDSSNTKYESGRNS